MLISWGFRVFFAPKIFRSLSAKFLIGLVPVFLTVAAIGLAFLSQRDRDANLDTLAANIGNQAARVATSIVKHDARNNPHMANDLIRYLSSDRSVRCVEFLETAPSRVIAASPRGPACRNTDDEHLLVIPVGAEGSMKLRIVFNEEIIAASAKERRALDLILIAVAFIASIVSALIGFRFIVARPLARLHVSIKRISETGERIPVESPTGDELGDILRAFNEMLARETEKEEVLENANAEIRQLNLTLEDRVLERTEQLLESEGRLQHLVESFGSGIYIHKEFKPLYANETLLKMFGFDDLDDFMSLHSTETLLAPEERERIWGYHQARLRGLIAPTDYDFWALRKNGKKLYVNNRSFVVNWAGQEAVCTTLFDLTERQETEKNLAEQQQLVQSLMETTHEGFWFIGLDRLTTDVNPAMCEILGVPRDEVIGRSIFEFVDETNATIFRNEIALRDKGKTTAYEIEIKRPDGSAVPCLNNATPLFNAEGVQIGSVGIWADISEIKMTQRSLEHEKERAQAANIAKSEFLAIASHELRTPMNGVLGMASLLKQSGLTDEQQERVETLEESGKALLGLLNEILDISKIESGNLELETANFELREMLHGVGSLMGSRAQQIGLHYTTIVDPDIPDVLVGDRTRVRQVLLNMVGNAVKFTRNGSISVTVSCIRFDQRSTRLRFAVDDTGIGIDKNDQVQIFEKFTQADSSTTREFGGTGLGLAICKELVELMGGAIGVESSKGRGSRFWFEVDFEIGDQSAVDAKTSPDVAAQSTENFRPLRILVAEDNPVNQEIVRYTLLDAGHRVDVVANGLEAVAAVKDTDYDIILMDAHMPHMDGLTATKKIRELQSPLSDIPIIALTADAMVGDREKFINAGMNDYISKPFDVENLLAIMARHVGINRIPPTPVPSDIDEEPLPARETGFDAMESGLAPETSDSLREKKPDLWKKLVGIYLAETPNNLNELQNALSTGDFAAARLAAHTIKSSSANMGALKLADLSNQIETAAETADLENGRRFLPAVLDEYDIVAAALDHNVPEEAVE